MSQLPVSRSQLTLAIAIVFLLGGFSGFTLDRLMAIKPINEYGGDYGSGFDDDAMPLKMFSNDKQPEVRSFLEEAQRKGTNELRIIAAAGNICSSGRIKCGSLDPATVDKAMQTAILVSEKRDSDQIAIRSVKASEASARSAEFSLYISGIAIIVTIIVAIGKSLIPRARVHVPDE